MEKVVEHIRHGQLIGCDYISISANFAGIPSVPEGLDDASEGCWEEFAPGCGRRSDELAAKLQKTVEDDITHFGSLKFLQEIYDSRASR